MIIVVDMKLRKQYIEQISDKLEELYELYEKKLMILNQ